MYSSRTAGSPRLVSIALILGGIIVSGILPLYAAQADDQEMPIPSPVDESAPQSTKLTLQNCIDLALQNNHARSASCYSIEIAEAQHRQAISAYWPQVGVKATYSILDEDPNFIFPGRNISLPQGMTIPVNTPYGPYELSSLPVSEQKVKLMDRQNFIASLNATVPLYTGGKISSIVRQAEQGIRAAREESRRTDLQVIYDTTRYYYGAVLGKELL
ncbi:MAG: TolC family protein, partial [Geobacteraceae bacterium]|nr:TolC family protein [Geobacteraceae bacterium]